MNFNQFLIMLVIIAVLYLAIRYLDGKHPEDLSGEVESLLEVIKNQDNTIIKFREDAKLGNLRADKCHEKMNYQQLEIERLNVDNTDLKRTIRELEAKRASEATVINPEVARAIKVIKDAEARRFSGKQNKHRLHKG